MQETAEINTGRELSAEFCKILRHLRRSNNLSYAKLAKMVNVSPSYLFRIENMERRNPSTKLTLKLAEALNSNFETLLTKDINEHVEKVETQDFATLIILNDFTVKGYSVSDGVKEQLIQLSELLFDYAMTDVPRIDFFHQFVSTFDALEAELRK